MAKKEIDKSRRNFLFGAVRRIRNENPDGPVAATASTVDAMKAANALYVDEEWDAARGKYMECMEADKNDADLRYRLGVCLYRLGKHLQAKLEFERALRIRRDYRDALLYLGLTLVRLDRAEKAVALWKQYFNPLAVPVQRELNLQIGMLEEGMADPPDAIAEAVEKAIAASTGQVG
ncbi:tetratricopeptide repeat protein [Pseudodesulfovibrio sp.]|uniref:tetratricopeptide repeat protein n=1 Tax=Pseudodesulfovibrio sp. TaxID=2035812 RepID=UPI002634FD4C|nr:tetratricopeptide repeat protein [Pseudodesulfovibrio sp.]MDD3311876.1 tetratricopeptide repeat protein [Pseudodesulfovibrio sp.]